MVNNGKYERVSFHLHFKDLLTKHGLNINHVISELIEYDLLEERDSIYVLTLKGKSFSTFANHDRIKRRKKLIQRIKDIKLFVSVGIGMLTFLIMVGKLVSWMITLAFNS